MRYFDALAIGNDSDLISKSQPLAIIKTDNVSRYFYEESPQEVWSCAKDFPNVAPLFPRYFMEADAPRYIFSDECGRNNWTLYDRIGIAVDAHEVNSYGFHPPRHDDVVYRDYLNRKIRWAVSMCILCDWPKLKRNLPQFFLRPNSDLLAVMTFGVLEDGQFACLEEDTALFARLVSPDLPKSKTGDILMKELDTWMYPFFLATSFMHCKNVDRIENIPAEKQNIIHQKEYGTNLTKYYTLNIRPLQKIIRHESGEPGNALTSRSMHICRGHFKDFRQSGLFGKYRGMFWWDSQVRGSAEKGKIVKDYNINPPTVISNSNISVN